MKMEILLQMESVDMLEACLVDKDFNNATKIFYGIV